MRAPTGNRITQKQHLASKAVDHSASPDPYVYAPEDGVIDSYAYRGLGTNSAGNVLRLRGATGLHSLCHLERSYVNVGQAVKKGDRLAKMGYTGYTIPSGPAGTHLHYYIQRPNGSYTYPPTLYSEPFNPPEGGNVSKTDLNIARIMAYHIAGRDGFDGRPNALAGKSDADLNKNHVGKETNGELWAWYNSSEGKNYREKILPTVYNQREAYKKNLNEVTTDRDALIKKYDAAKAEAAKVPALEEQNDTLKTQVEAANSIIDDQKDQIAKLQKQLEQGSTFDPNELNVVGQFCWVIINKIGRK